MTKTLKEFIEEREENQIRTRYSKTRYRNAAKEVTAEILRWAKSVASFETVASVEETISLGELRKYLQSVEEL